MSGRRLLAVGLAVALALAACGDDGDPGDGGPSPGSPTTTAVPPAELAAALCEATATTAEPLIASPELVELSGLAYSTTVPGLLWAHNDSGDAARVFALDEIGADLGSVAIEGAGAFDVEDMAAVRDADGVGRLYLADIGDNAGRRETVSVVRIPEPDPPANPGVEPALGAEEVERIELRYPEGPRDAESLIVDPRTGVLTIIHKRLAGAAEVYEAEPVVGGTADLVKVGLIDFEAIEDQPDPPELGAVTPLALVTGTATGADIDPSGSVIVVRTYGAVFVWPREDGQSVAQALVENEPCSAPSVPEDQGEAIAVRPDTSGYVTVSEGQNPPVHVFTTP